MKEGSCDVGGGTAHPLQHTANHCNTYYGGRCAPWGMILENGLREDVVGDMYLNPLCWQQRTVKICQ